MIEKQKFQTNIEKQILEWQAQMNEYSERIKEFKVKAEQLEEESKLQYLEQIQELEHRIDAVKNKIADGQQRLDTLKSAGDEAWEEVKVGSEKAWDELVQGINTAWGEVKTSLDLASSKIQDRLPKE